MTKEDVGPIEARQWPRELVANAVSPDGGLFGYLVEDDLARNYSLAEVLYLSLTGDLPDEPTATAFAATLVFASAVPVAEAPIHAAVLSRMCGVRPGGVLATSALALGEQIDRTLHEIGTTLDGDPTSLPTELRARSEAERASVARLRSLVGPLRVPVLALDPRRDVALVAVLRACGLTSPFQLSVAMTVARLPSAIAEASRVSVGAFKTYPMDTPHFEYDPEASSASGRR